MYQVSKRVHVCGGARPVCLGVGEDAAGAIATRALG